MSSIRGKDSEWPRGGLWDGDGGELWSLYDHGQTKKVCKACQGLHSEAKPSASHRKSLNWHKWTPKREKLVCNWSHNSLKLHHYTIEMVKFKLKPNCYMPLKPLDLSHCSIWAVLCCWIRLFLLFVFNLVHVESPNLTCYLFICWFFVLGSKT